MSVTNTPVSDAIVSRILDRGISRACYLIPVFFGMSLIANCGGVSSEATGVDPGVFEVPIAYVKRPVPVNNQGQAVQADLREPRIFSSGGDVFIRTSSTSGATESNITSSVTQGTGDAKGISTSFDGKRIIFSLRLLDPDPNDTYHLQPATT